MGWMRSINILDGLDEQSNVLDTGWTRSNVLDTAGREVLTSWTWAGQGSGQKINILDMGWMKSVNVLDMGWTKNVNILDVGWTKALTTTVVQIVLFILVWFVQMTVVME